MLVHTLAVSSISGCRTMPTLTPRSLPGPDRARDHDRWLPHPCVRRRADQRIPDTILVLRPQQMLSWPGHWPDFLISPKPYPSSHVLKLIDTTMIHPEPIVRYVDTGCAVPEGLSRAFPHLGAIFAGSFHDG